MKTSDRIATPMTAELPTGLPSVRQIQSLIRETSEVEIMISTKDLLVGKIRWQDTDCICLVDHYDQPTIIWKQAIVYLKPKS